MGPILRIDLLSLALFVAFVLLVLVMEMYLFDMV